jgi:hypothetical protein
MKRLTIIFISLFLIAGPAAAYDNAVDVRVGGLGFMNDTIRTGFPVEFQFYIENDFRLAGMSLGFQIWSPDGATWSWEDVGGLGNNTGCVTIEPGCRLGENGSNFDMTGLVVTEQNINELGRDTIMCGGVAMMKGIAPGPLQHMYNYHFIAGGISPGETGTLCIDSCFVPPSGAFVFVTHKSSPVHPTPLWPEGGLCIPVAHSPCCCPEWDQNNPTTLTIPHCETGAVTLSATDAEAKPISFALNSLNGGNGTAEVIDNGDGTCLVNYIPAPSDLGQTISIVVDLSNPIFPYGHCIPWTLDVEVTNSAPSIDCGAMYNPACFGQTIHKLDIIASDPDGCDDLTYFMVSGPGFINAATGEYIWTTSLYDTGLHVVCVGVTDGIDTAVCCFEADVFGCERLQVVIDKVHDVLQGHFVDVDVCLNKGSELFGGFDFLIGYDASALAFTEAALGDFFVQCGWEYFTYRYNWNGNCGNACPSGLLRLIGLAETNNGPNHPNWDCLTEYDRGYGCSDCGTPIATLTFYVSNDRTFECCQWRHPFRGISGLRLRGYRYNRSHLRIPDLLWHPG